MLEQLAITCSNMCAMLHLEHTETPVPLHFLTFVSVQLGIAAVFCFVGLECLGWPLGYLSPASVPLTCNAISMSMATQASSL